MKINKLLSIESAMRQTSPVVLASSLVHNSCTSSAYLKMKRLGCDDQATGDTMGLQAGSVVRFGPKRIFSVQKISI